MKKRKDLSKEIVTISFVLYLLLLTWIIVFKVRIDISSLKYIRSINFIPFKSNGSINGMKETIINLLLFIPLGMYLQFFSKKQKYMSITMVILISFIFEILQYVFHIGVSDITDIIMNTLGGIIGMLLMFILYKLLNKKINSDQVNIIISHLSLLIPIALFCSLFLL